KVLKAESSVLPEPYRPVSVLYREPKVLKGKQKPRQSNSKNVSVLYREPKVLKEKRLEALNDKPKRFSALP
ncbi:hypothetical protein, partial [Chloroflexus sp.]|uniref:hypothetical protein n=1 Tax=Chloroflexus sp. TaxID=1904827 RepID=UPI003C783D61